MLYVALCDALQHVIIAICYCWLSVQSAQKTSCIQMTQMAALIVCLAHVLFLFFSTASNIQTWKHYCEWLLCSLFLPGGEGPNSLRIITDPSTKFNITNSNKLICVCVFFFPQWQSKFKSQGNKLIPDSQEEQALMYQRMFEGLTFYDKLSKTQRQKLFLLLIFQH